MWTLQPTSPGSQGQAFSGFYFLSVLYFVLFLPFMFYILSGCGGGLGPGGGGGGCLVWAAPATFLSLIVFFNFFTLWRPLFFTSPCLQVFIRGKTSMVPLF